MRRSGTLSTIIDLNSDKLLANSPNCCYSCFKLLPVASSSPITRSLSVH